MTYEKLDLKSDTHIRICLGLGSTDSLRYGVAITAQRMVWKHLGYPENFAHEDVEFKISPTMLNSLVHAEEYCWSRLGFKPEDFFSQVKDPDERRMFHLGEMILMVIKKKLRILHKP